MLVLQQSAKGALKAADTSVAISQALKILQSRHEASTPFLNDINDNVALLKSKLQLQGDVAV